MTSPTKPATAMPTQRHHEHRHEPQRSHALQPTATGAPLAIALRCNTTAVAAVTALAIAAKPASAAADTAAPTPGKTPTADARPGTAPHSGPGTDPHCSEASSGQGQESALRADTDRDRKGGNTPQPRHHLTIAAALTATENQSPKRWHAIDSTPPSLPG